MAMRFSAVAIMSSTRLYSMKYTLWIAALSTKELTLYSLTASISLVSNCSHSGRREVGNLQPVALLPEGEETTGAIAKRGHSEEKIVRVQVRFE
jgi:hypothetical protein